MQHEELISERLRQVGKSVERLDSRQKVTGVARYANDLRFPNMLHAKIKRSTEPHARIKSMDMSRAAEIPGVLAIISGKDVRSEDSPEHPPALAVDTARFVGEAVAAVAAVD